MGHDFCLPMADGMAVACAAATLFVVRSADSTDSDNLPSRPATSTRSACAGRHFQRGGAIGGGHGAVGRLSLHDLLIDSDDPGIRQHRFRGHAPAGRKRWVVQRLGQDHVDPVAGPDQAGRAADGVHRDRDRAHVRTQHGGEKAMIAGMNHVRRQDRLAFAKRCGGSSRRSGCRGLAACHELAPAGTSAATISCAARSSGLISEPARSEWAATRMTILPAPATHRATQPGRARAAPASPTRPRRHRRCRGPAWQTVRPAEAWLYPLNSTRNAPAAMAEA